MDSSLIIAVLIPLALVQVGLLAWALTDLAKRDGIKGGNKALWVILILLFEFLGPILYLAWGREE